MTALERWFVNHILHDFTHSQTIFSSSFYNLEEIKHPQEKHKWTAVIQNEFKIQRNYLNILSRFYSEGQKVNIVNVIEDLVKFWKSPLRERSEVVFEKSVPLPFVAGDAKTIYLLLFATVESSWNSLHFNNRTKQNCQTEIELSINGAIVNIHLSFRKTHTNDHKEQLNEVVCFKDSPELETDFHQLIAQFKETFNGTVRFSSEAVSTANVTIKLPLKR